MKRWGSKGILCLFLLGGLLILPLPGKLLKGYEITVKLRLYEGISSLAHEPQTVVTSSYLCPLVSAKIPSGYSQEEEEKQIKRVFNLLDVRLLNEAELLWSEPEIGPKDYVLRFDSREMLVRVNPINFRNRFRIVIQEQTGVKKVDLLDTEIILPRKNIAVFGFESTAGIPYFLSFHALRLEETGLSEFQKKAVVGGVVGGVVKGAVKATGKIKPPKLIKMVDPVYPPEAKKAGIEGVVILEVETDTSGRVVRTKVLRSIPLLDQAAIEAVRQWVYEPMIIDGEPRGLIFTVTVSFKLRK